MIKRWKKILTMGIFILCVMLSNVLSVDAADSTPIEYDSGVVVQLFNDITKYRAKDDFTVPKNPEGFEDYVFAGWYTDANCKKSLDKNITSESITDSNKAAYAKFVPGDVLSIKAQLVSGTNYATESTAIRFITTVDSLKYQKLGFKYEIEGNTEEYETNEVYRKIYVMDDKTKFQEAYTPDIFHYMSKYFLSFKVINIANEDFGHGVIVTPYWITLDGTKVYGVTALKTANMGYTPSLTEVTSTSVAEISYPTVTGGAMAGEWTGSTIVSEGGCTDGEYYYQAVIHKAVRTNPEEPDSTKAEYDESQNEVVIQKYEMQGDSWTLAKQSSILSLDHANDMTYNSELTYTKDEETKKGLLVVCRNGNWEEKYKISFLDPDNLTIVKPMDIDGYEKWEAKSPAVCTTCKTSMDKGGTAVDGCAECEKCDEYINIAEQIYCIDYNATTNRYVIGISPTQKFKIMDSNFNIVSDVSTPTDQTANYTTQGVGSDDAYVYLVYSLSNTIAAYDWDGNFVTLIKLNSMNYEAENLGVYNNKFHVSCNDNSGTRTVAYRIDTFSSTESNITDESEEMPLHTTAVTDVYAETTVKVSEVAFDSASNPRTGLRINNGNGKAIDFILSYDKEMKDLQDVVAVEVDTSTNKDISSDEQRHFSINSALDEDGAIGIKLAVAKVGDTFYFYVNDVLQGTRTYADFGSDVTVTANLYSNCTNSEYFGYSVKTDSNKIKTKLTSLHDIFAAYESKKWCYFDLLNEEDYRTPEVTLDEQLWNGSIVNWHDVSGKVLLAETTIELKGSNGTDKNGNVVNAFAGLVLTDEVSENQFYVMLVGKEGKVTKIECYSKAPDTVDNAFDDKKLVYENTVSLTGKHKLTVSRNDNLLTIFLDDKQQTVVDLSSVENSITDNTTVGLAGWKAQATFTHYNAMEENAVSDVIEAADVFAINKTASANLYAETTIKVSETSTEYWSRAGLRFTNQAGEHVDFVLTYDLAGNLKNVMAVKVNKDGSDIAGTEQYYSIDSVLGTASQEGIKLAASKIGDTFYFYVNDVLQGTKTYSRFGSNNKVTADLYSKFTKSTFSNFADYSTNVTTIEAKTAEYDDIFVADTKKPTIYFDLLEENDETTPQITVNEQIWNGSIVNWNGISTTKLYAETNINLTGSNGTDSNGNVINAQAGIVLTSGENRFFVMLSGKQDGITSLECYSMTNDVIDNYHATKYPTGKVREYDKTVSLTGDNKLAVYRDENEMYILLNDKVQKVIDLSKVTYPITEATQVGLAGWKAQATFTDYSAKVDAEMPTLETYNPLTVQNNMSSFEWNTEFNTTDKEILLGVKSTNKSEIQTLLLSEKTTKDIYAETTISIPEVNTNYWARTGLRLTNQDGKTLEFVLGYNKNTGYVGSTVIVLNDTTILKETDFGETITSFTPGSTDSVKLAIAKSGDKLYFYLNDTLVDSRVDGNGFFAADATVTASLFSKYTISSYSDYKVLEGYESDASKNTDTMALNTSAVTDVYAETIINIDSFGNVNWPRVGLRFTNDADKKADFYIAYNNTDRSNPKYTAVERALNEKSLGGFANANEATVVKPEGIKLGVAKIGSEFYVYINDVSYGSVTVDGFDATTEVTVSLYSKNTESMFTGFGLPEMDETIALATDTFAESGATKSVVLSDTGVPKMEVQLSGATSGAHKYLYFKEKNTKVSAETVIDLLPATDSQQRVGIVLTDENKSAQLGFYLYAAEGGTAGVTALQIYSLSGFANGWGDLPTERNVPLQNIGRENIKLSVKRDGDNYSVYVNDNLVYNGTLSAISNFNMDATTETYIGLIAMQTGATFSDFTYSYGSEVN